MLDTSLPVRWNGWDSQLEEGRENSIDLVTAAAIKEWVDGVQIVGEFGFNQAEQVLPVAEKLGLDAVQLGMFVPEFEFEQLEDYNPESRRSLFRKMRKMVVWIQ